MQAPDASQLAALDDLSAAAHRHLTPNQGVDDFAVDTLSELVRGIRSGEVKFPERNPERTVIVSAGVTASYEIDLDAGELTNASIDDGDAFDDYDVLADNGEGVFEALPEDDPRRDEVAELMQEPRFRTGVIDYGS